MMSRRVAIVIGDLNSLPMTWPKKRTLTALLFLRRGEWRIYRDLIDGEINSITRLTFKFSDYRRQSAGTKG
jgi:hypothetical protein